MPRLSKIGAACLAAFGFTTGGVQNVTASYLVVAGGGSGASVSQNAYGCAAGGGAGGLQTGTTSLNPTLSYTVIVGAGAPSVASPTSGVLNGNQGSSSSLGALSASIGGGYGSATGNGGSGGSGGGGEGSLGSGGSPTSGQGNSGGNGVAPYGAGGGGGASASGGNGSIGASGAGGNGSSSSISGSSVTYAGGGGAGGNSLGYSVGSGGTGGGGAGGANNANGVNGTANTGGGGGGSGTGNGSTVVISGAGGSGIVIISYPLPQQFGGGVVTTDGTNCIHTFTTSGTLSPLNSLTASYLIVAGGAGGGYRNGGGGGAGGLLSGSGMTIDTNSTYLVTVGSGGAGSGTSGVNGVSGGNSSFSLLTAAIGGGGGGTADTATAIGVNGGSGGGGAGNNYVGGTHAGGSGTSGQGYAGGTGTSSSPNYSAGGGGGAGAVGGNGAASGNGGAGGNGISSSISGTAAYYAGGGGGGSGGGAGGAGGLGGGGNGSANSSDDGLPGTTNTGGGGGGAYGAGSGRIGGNGGSGIIIISYPGTTQQMAGGTVTIVGGNVIHTFTSSGYLTPLTFVGNSLRFRSSASAYLNKTLSTPTNNKIFTWSGWIKRGISGNNFPSLFIASTTNTTNSFDNIGFDTDRLTVYWNGAASGYLVTNAVYRDYAAWYHIVVAVDTTQATASNRCKLYVNGSQVTSFSTETYPSQNYTQLFNSAISHKIGISQNTSGLNYPYDGYMANVQFIDGQALAPTAFGSFNAYGVWQPINYGGSYGNNGFYLPFSNTTSTTTLGYDFSPMGNNWTTNNISLTAGATYDSMTDVPTLTSATAANYAVWNPLNTYNTVGNYTDGNLNYSYPSSAGSGTSFGPALSTIAAVQGDKVYFEFTSTTSSYPLAVGISQVGTQHASNQYAGYNATEYYYNASNGNKLNNNTSSSYGASFTAGDVIGCALDLVNNQVTFYKNGVSQGVAFTGLSGSYHFGVGTQAGGNTCTGYANFGQQPWQYAPPSGFVALNTYNL